MTTKKSNYSLGNAIQWRDAVFAQSPYNAIHTYLSDIVEYIIRGKDVADDWEKANEIKTWLLNRILDADNHYYDIVVNIENFIDILKEAEKTERIEKAIDFLWRMRMEVDNIQELKK